jgi:hypothetical protein
VTRSPFKSAAHRWQEFTHRRFGRLVHHCINRIFRNSISDASGSSEEELDLGIGVVLALLSLPGAFSSLFLSEKYGSLFLWLRGVRYFDPYGASLPDEYFFIALSMVAAGSVAVWKWDSLLPDRRDYANLAPLPLHRHTVFFANLIALLLLASVISVDINAISSVLFPLLVCSSHPSLGYLTVFFATHLLSVVMAGTFGFLAVLAFLGTLMSLLPYRTFRKVSVWSRTLMVCFFAALLTTSFSVPLKIARLPRTAQSWRRLPPPAWFLGLCQSLRGRGDPLLAALGRAAILGSATVFVLAIAGYSLGYGRSFARSAETVGRLPGSRGDRKSHFFRLADGAVLRTPFERAAYRFVLWTLFRSEVHALVFGCSAALGVMLVAQTLLAHSANGPHAFEPFPSAEALSVPLVLSYFLISGLRFAFEIPAPLRANWLFRMAANPLTARGTSIAKRVIFTFELPLLALCFGAYDWYWGWRIALLHTALVGVMSLLLIETLLLEFRKIPFTCPAPSFRSNAIVFILVYFFGFLGFSSFTADLEHAAFVDPLPLAYCVPILLAMWWLGLCLWRKYFGNFDRRITFEEIPHSGVELLDLTFRR